jgi:hypothetical protein
MIFFSFFFETETEDERGSIMGVSHRPTLTAIPFFRKGEKWLERGRRQAVRNHGYLKVPILPR